jgi:hypothetical protein
MRSRLTAVVTLLALLAVALVAPAAQASTTGTLLAQEQPTEEPAVEGGEGQNEGGDGQGDPDAESGASEEEAEGSATEETGPPWTYQMARITLVLLLFLALGLAYLYYRLVAQRRKGEV